MNTRSLCFVVVLGVNLNFVLQSFSMNFLSLLESFMDVYYLKGQGIKSVYGLYPLHVLHKKRKISGIEFIYIKEY